MKKGNTKTQMKTKTNQRVKQSFIAGALTSSAGVFLSKFLGLFYIVPFTAMATQTNMHFYSAAYSLYDTMLTICSAGIPFAVSAMVAKYMSHDDYKTALLVRRLSMGLMLASGFIMAVVLIIFSGPFAEFSSSKSATLENISTLQNVICYLSLSLFLVPFLSAYRGFYQGLKDFISYGLSQTLEQLVRIVMLLGLGAICVYVLHLDNIWAVRMAVFSTGLAALITILYFAWHDRSGYAEVKQLAKQQNSEAVETKDLLKEMVAFGLPYMMMSILGNSMNIVNTLFMQRELTEVSAELAQLYYSIVQTNCNKLTSIPQVLAIGFSTGIVPHLTTNLEQRDFVQLKRNVLAALNTVCYIGLPLSFCLFALAEPIYSLMYGAKYLEIGKEALMYSSMLAVTGTISPITTSMMMSLRYRKRCLEFLAIGFASKVITFFLFIDWFGYTGAITSSVITGLVVIFLNLSYIKNKFHISFKGFYRNLIVISIGLVSMNGMFVVLRWIGVDGLASSKLMNIAELGILGILGVIVYFLTTAFFQLPQRIFKMSLSKMMSKLKRGRR